MSDNVVRLHADTEICISAGMCARTAPDVFDQDDATGVVVVRSRLPEAADLDAVRRAVACCPSGALTLTGEPEGVGP
ncbi:ferredoxin [Mycolicibacterium sp. GF69]|uniref:ferredoxin n=1 Tax=Mycolicibacterium sp. GF69 TaxID=2267251 RepID=UPI000DCB395F|nr:(4Fe-4S)-binding protein [Mycolicibacterium sp. GF69]RAV06018.1 ferredoxin [Mycolicibacterium sp. GF69]